MKLSIFQKRDNVPSTVDVLRAGKIKQTADELKKMT